MIAEAAHPVDYHMPIPQSTRLQFKRQRMEQFSEQSDISQLEPESKRQKHEHPIDKAEAQRRPTEFWDNLSKIWLTREALRELDRRNSESASRSSHTQNRRPHRPITRQFFAELESKHLIQNASDFLGRCGPQSLEEIKQLSKRGGPDLSGLRSFPQYSSHPDITMSSTQPQNKRRCSTATPSSNKRSSRTGGTYSRNFEQHLIDHGIYPEGYRYPGGRKSEKPKNWTEINQRLSQPRASLSPSKFADEEFETFKEANTYASNELPTTTLVPTIEGGINDPKTVGGGYPFGNLKPLTDGTISSAWPDRFFGARPEQLDRKVRDDLSDTIIPSTQDSRPMLPNFFLEVKGPEESAAVAKRQARYDGALGARAMQSLQSYGKNDPVYDNNTYTIASTYYDGTLKMYTSHPVKPNGARNDPEYIMTQLNSWSMTGNVETFRQGATWYRNARHWAGEKRDEFVMAGNTTLSKEESQRISTSENMTVSASTGVSINSDSTTNSDETEFEDAQWSFADPVGDQEEKEPGGSNNHLRRLKNTTGDTTAGE